ncbi:c-type cytochrome [Enterovirga sp. DB1703]|uniref:C-type cytochrome n=1 Tax=Enterovirga aerilata TaxID=2730920 RepID=A0A849I617_9HYPH|nr:c-type cytochrome [Enterovirga sp. DB1703]
MAGAASAWVLSAPKPAFSAVDEERLAGGDAARGRLVFDAAQCASCHASPGQPDRLRLGGGMALATPLGTLRPANISPHPSDGIGGWSAVEIANAVMSGVSPGGQHYYPAFPWTSYVRMEAGDMRDLVAYLRTLPPVGGRPQPHDLSFPFTLRRGIGLWKLLFFDAAPLPAEPARSPGWQRGRYLVEALAHCAECHSPRNLTYAVKPEQRFAGGLNPEQAGSAPNITPDRIGSWSEAQIAEVLTSGRTPDLRYVGATMAEVVANMSRLTPEDRAAIAAYVKSLQPRPTPAEARQHRYPRVGEAR